MTKTFAMRLAAISAVAILCSCGDSSTGAKDDGDKSSKESVKSVSGLGKCSADRAGEVLYVEDEKAEYICIPNEWKNTGATENSEGDESDTSSSPSKNKSSSSTKGSSGSTSGSSSASDSGKNSSGSGSASSSSVAQEPTSSAPGANETIPTKPVSKAFSGVVQKGPFTSGSTMKIWELDEDLALTGTKFEWEVSSSLGEFSSPKLNLATQYGLLQATGTFYNEVSGSTTTGDFTLKGIVDLSNRDKANLNILAHLAYNRAMALFATGDYKNIPAAKSKAEQEVMEAFYMNPKDAPLNHAFEDLSIFGTTNDDAKLLAVSILLTRGLNPTGITSTTAELSADIKDDGKWNQSSESTTQVTVADWALNNLANNSKIRTRVETQGGNAPDFERWIGEFIEGVYSIPCTDKLDGNMEQIAVAGSSYNGKKLVCDGGSLRFATRLDTLIGYACTASRDGVIKSYIDPYYGTKKEQICDSGVKSWRDVGIYDYSKEDFFSETANYGTLKDSRDNKTYKTIKIGSQTWMAENLDYSDSTKMTNLKGNSWCFNNRPKNCEMAGRLYTWTAAMNLASFYLEESAADVIAEKHQGACPDGWHIPTSTEWNDLMEYVEAKGTEYYAGSYLKSKTGWQSYSTSVKSLDEYGFSAIPTGAYYGKYANAGETYSAYTFDDEGQFTNFWSATEAPKTAAATKALYWFLDYRYNYFDVSTDYNQKGRGFPIRCVKN